MQTDRPGLTRRERIVYPPGMPETDLQQDPDGTSLEAQRLRSRLFAETRAFLSAAGYLEVDVPVLAPTLIPEGHLEVFETAFLHPYVDPPRRSPLYLTPSPEVYLKRLLAAGWPSLFAISRAFRNAEAVGPQHNPEFTMLEFYTRRARAEDSIPLMAGLLDHLLRSLEDELEAYRARRRRRPLPELLRGGAERLAAERAGVDELMRRHAGLPAGWAESMERLQAAARGVGVLPSEAESFESLFNRIFVHFVEPALPREGLCFVTDYPAAVPTLARDVEERPWSERWELYLCGLEVANCYTEETRPDRVAAFFHTEHAKKQSSLVPHPSDPAYPDLFGESSEPLSGVAVGMDRLLMAVLGAKEIKEVMVFPTRPVV